MRWPVRATALTPGDTPDPPPVGTPDNIWHSPGLFGISLRQPSSTPGPPPPTVTNSILRHGTPAMQLFHPTLSWVNQPRPTDGTLLVDANTPSIAAEIAAENTTGNRAYLATTKYSVPLFVVPVDFPRLPIKLHTQPVPNYQLEMQQILLDPGVPLPPDYVNPAPSSDDSAAVLELNASGILTRAKEFWRLRPITPVDYTFTQSDGTSVTYPQVKWECTTVWNITTIATHAARARNHNTGTYPNAPVPITSVNRLDTEDTNMSVSAAKIPFVGTMLTEEDVVRGHVDHVLNLSVIYPMPSIRYWPATATDGFKTGSPVAEGMRLFLDNVAFSDAVIAGMDVHPLCKRVIQGVRDYGIIILDKAGSLEIDAEVGVGKYLNGTAASSVLNGFPWGSLQCMAQTNGDGTALTDANPFPR